MIIQLYPESVVGRDAPEIHWVAVLHSRGGFLELKRWHKKADALAWCEEFKRITGARIFFAGEEWST